jgi:hypothetical protein
MTKTKTYYTIESNNGNVSAGLDLKDLNLILDALDIIHANDKKQFYPKAARQAGHLYDRLRDELGLVFDGDGDNAPYDEVFPN